MADIQNGNCDWQLNNEDCGELTMTVIIIAELVVEGQLFCLCSCIQTLTRGKPFISSPNAGSQYAIDLACANVAHDLFVAQVMTAEIVASAHARTTMVITNVANMTTIVWTLTHAPAQRTRVKAQYPGMWLSSLRV